MNLDFIFDLPIINWLPEPLQALLLIILFVLFIKLVIAIFLHPLYSRIAGLIVAIIALIVGLNIPDTYLGAAEMVFGASIGLSVIYTFSYLLSMGSEVFDTYWDGTYTLTISDNMIDLSKTISGGFLANFLGGSFCGWFLSLLALSSMPFLLWLIPIILALANIVLIYKVTTG